MLSLLIKKIADDYKKLVSGLIKTLHDGKYDSVQNHITFSAITQKLSLSTRLADKTIVREILGDLKDCGLINTNMDDPRDSVPFGRRGQGKREKYWLTEDGVKFAETLRDKGTEAVFAFVDPEQSLKLDYFTLKPHVTTILQEHTPTKTVITEPSITPTTVALSGNTVQLGIILDRYLPPSFHHLRERILTDATKEMGGGGRGTV